MRTEIDSRNGESTRSQHSGKTALSNAGIDRLRARSEADTEAALPPAWTAEPGDELLGRFLRWQDGTTSRGETHPVAVIEEENGEHRSCWAFYKVLRSKLEGIDPQAGELLLITRKPDRKSKAGKGYRDYAVVVDRDE